MSRPWGELPDAIQLQARWIRLFEGEYSEAKKVIDRLDAASVPNRLSIPEDGATSSTVAVAVMRRSLPYARVLIA
jgi:hypothetical protein